MLGAGVIGFFMMCFLIMIVLRFTVWGPWNHRIGCGMGGMGRMGGSMDAEEIIRQRYARGEITKEQYDQMLRDLRYSKN